MFFFSYYLTSNKKKKNRRRSEKMGLWSTLVTVVLVVSVLVLFLRVSELSERFGVFQYELGRAVTWDELRSAQEEEQTLVRTNTELPPSKCT